MNAILLLFLFLTFLLSPGFAIEDESPLSTTLRESIDGWLQAERPSEEDDWPVYRQALQDEEALEPVFAYLKEDVSINALWLKAKLHWRYGLLDEARKFFENLAEETSSPLAAYRVAQLLDASGKEKEAVEAYKSILDDEKASAWHGDVRLRLAILKSTGGKVEGELDDLTKYAEEAAEEAFKNRSAVVLALAGKPKDAMDLYKVTGEEASVRFKQEIRRAEWAMAAKQHATAQEAAWSALQEAKLRRDRRYALTILSESYRVDKKLDVLVGRFAEEENLDEDTRFTWIDLLRELGKADEALALFKEAASEQEKFTVEMRRELLEICRETGKEEVLVDAYREAIAGQPDRLEWRAGLSRFFLEAGNQEEGRQVWNGYREAARTDDVLAGAGTALELGLEDLAVAYAEHCITSTDRVVPALQFLFEMHRARGRDDAMVAVLDRMEALAEPDSADRVQLAESWEQIGRQDKAADVLERLREARGAENFSADLEMRLAWLYSEIGNEDKAYDYWRNVWLRVDSPGRRRYVEDRLMATASRLGKLADIAIELEEKLIEGKADKRDSGLLVRLYTKVGDPVSATEIIQEFLKQSGGSDVQVLEEKARIYVMCNDYYHYERTLRDLMELDPGGKPEYLTQLAMSSLERGKNDEARAVLSEMRGLEQNAASAEFEAGVLKIAGMHEEATQAYWRGIGEHPDRIDAYLLLGQSLQTVGKARQAQGVFQYLVENADKDDLFTIAVDGLLNARAGQPVMRWARRVILERIASRDDKVYLYQLLGDISEELRDQPMMMRALSETLPIAGERRTSQLRELVELSKVGVGGSGFSSRSTGRSARDRDGLMRFGRRLIGMGEAVPPQVHLDLGQAFLDGGDIRSAAKTFARAEDLSDYAGFQRKVATSFEQKLYIKSALRLYEKLLLGDHADVGLLIKLGELKEQLGRDDEARQAYERALDQLIDLQPMTSSKDQAVGQTQGYVYARNQDAYGKYFSRAMKAFLTTASPGEELDSFLEIQEQKLAAELRELGEMDRPEDERVMKRSPRVNRRAGLIRRAAVGFDQQERIRRVYRDLLRVFPRDAELLPSLCQTLLTFGLEHMADELLAEFPQHPSAEAGQKYLQRSKGGSGNGDLFHMLITGDAAEARRQLRQAAGEAEGQTGGLQGPLFGAALFLRDTTTLRRLARQVLVDTPSEQVWQYTSVLARVWPHLNDQDRDSLVDLVEAKLESIESSKNSSMHYYIQQLNKLTGRQFRLSLDHVRAPLENILSRGGFYLNSIGNLFNVLRPEDYSQLLKETFPKAKKSDRLHLLFNLLKSYDGEMDPELEDLFRELVLEAAAGARTGVVEAWNKARRYYYDEREQQVGFSADLLGELSEGLPEVKRAELDAIRAPLLLQCGRKEEALVLAKRVQKMSLEPDSELGKNVAQQMQRVFLPDHLNALLEAFAELRGEDEAENLALAKSKIALIRQSGRQSLLRSHLLQAAAEFPDEKSFQDEHRRMLESMGLIWEAVQVQEAVVEKDPKNAAARNQLAALWSRLEHPLKAVEAKKLPPDEPEEKKPEDDKKKAEEKQANEPAKTTAAARVTPAVPPAAQPARAAASPSTATVPVVATQAASATKVAADSDKEADSEEEEKAEKLSPATMASVKKAMEDGKTEEVHRLLRRIWRQFPNLDRVNAYYRVSTSLGAYQWPQSSTPRSSAANPGSLQGGMKRYLTKTVVDPNANRVRAANVRTVFEELGDEPGVQAEIERALRSLEPRDHRGSLFQRQIDAVAKGVVREKGLAKALSDALESLEGDADVDLIRRSMNYALLEMGTESGDESLAPTMEALRDALFEKARATDTVALGRLARCLAVSGKPQLAVKLYRWCAGNTFFSPYDYGDGRLTTQSLVNDIREYLDGEMQVRALESVFELSRPTQIDARTMSPYYWLVLNTWKEVLPAEETLSRTRKICQEVLRDYPDNPMLTKLASVFLGSGGAVDEGIAALRRALTTPPVTGPNGMTMVFNSNGSVYYTSGGSARAKSKFAEADLRLFFPETLASWKQPGAWLEQLSTLADELRRDGHLPPEECVRVLALTAVHQHDLGLSEAAETTLGRLREIELTVPEDLLWVWDTAERLGRDDVWREIGLTMFRSRQLVIHRIPELIQATARVEGTGAALALGVEAIDYTAHPSVVSLCLRLATDSGQPEHVAFWLGKLTELLTKTEKPERYGVLVAANEAETLFRYEELKEGGEVTEEVGDISHRITLDESKGEVRVARLEEGKETPVGVRLTLTSEWRQQNPGGEVYLVSLLENAKTFVVKKGADGWRYYDDVAAPPADWAQPAFDDAAWAEGASPLGYGETVSTTLSYGADASNKTLTAYFRRRVEVDDPAEWVKAYAGVECDDGSIVYVNGKEVYRMNMREDDADTHTTTAAGKGEKGKTGYFFVDAGLFKKGENHIAISVHQADTGSSDLYMNFDLKVVTKSDLKKKSE